MSLIIYKALNNIFFSEFKHLKNDEGATTRTKVKMRVWLKAHKKLVLRQL